MQNKIIIGERSCIFTGSDVPEINVSLILTVSLCPQHIDFPLSFNLNMKVAAVLQSRFQRNLKFSLVINLYDEMLIALCILLYYALLMYLSIFTFTIPTFTACLLLVAASTASASTNPHRRGLPPEQEPYKRIYEDTLHSSVF